MHMKTKMKTQKKKRFKKTNALVKRRAPEESQKRGCKRRKGKKGRYKKTAKKKKKINKLGDNLGVGDLGFALDHLRDKED